ncbi:MAG: hypothetical protein ACLURV_06240 [Gallintestinimicrobium sp.]
MDYRKTAQQICDNIGGGKNIISAERCATVVTSAAREAIEAIDS